METLAGGNTTSLVDSLVELHGLNVPAGVDGTVGATGTLVCDREMPAAAGFLTLANTAVPEPGTLAVLGSAVAMSAGARRHEVLRIR